LTTVTAGPPGGTASPFGSAPSGAGGAASAGKSTPLNEQATGSSPLTATTTDTLAVSASGPPVAAMALEDNSAPAPIADAATAMAMPANLVFRLIMNCSSARDPAVRGDVGMVRAVVLNLTMTRPESGLKGRRRQIADGEGPVATVSLCGCS
jgi:hypothetical protein